MQNSARRLLHWTPRVLGILFAVFVSLLALDVFQEGCGFGDTLLALVIHLVPAMVLLAMVAVAWRWPAAGGILFLAAGAAYLAMTAGRFPWPAYALMCGVPWLAGILFLLDARCGRGLTPQP